MKDKIVKAMIVVIAAGWFWLCWKLWGWFIRLHSGC